MNPIKSGVSDYSEELLEYLAGYGRIDLFIDDYRPTSSWLYRQFRIRNFREIFENHGKNDHDLHVYHVGNNDIHSNIYMVGLNYPGLVVLHEPMLHHFIFSQTVGNDRVKDYLRELDYCYKSDRDRIVKLTLESRDESSFYDYPLVDRIVDSSLGVIVHSEYARRKVLDANPNARVKVIPHHYAPPPAVRMRSPEVLREILGLRQNEFLIGSLGYMTTNKRIDYMLKALAWLKGQGYGAKLLLVGKPLPGCEVPRWIEELGIQDDVLVTGFVDTTTFREYMNLPDIFVALRYPSAGETSGSVIKMMGTGSPVIVSDHFAFSEFPDDCCVKVASGPGEEEGLRERLAYFIENPDERLAFGARCREYILKNHDIQKSARQYAEFAGELLSGSASRTAAAAPALAREGARTA